MLKDLPTCARSSTLRTCPQIPKCLDMQGLQRKGQNIEQELSQIISNHRERLPFPHSDIYKLYVRAHNSRIAYNHYMFNTHTRVCIYIYTCVCLWWFYRCAHRCTYNCTQLHTDAYKHAYIHAYSCTCISLDTYGIGHSCRFRFGLIWALQYVMVYHKNCTQHNNHTTEHTIHTDLSLHADLSPFLSLSKYT